MPQIMIEALNLALYGMGTVFIFLTVLVGLTTLMSRFALYLDELNPPESESAAHSLGHSSAHSSVANETTQTSLVLIAAVSAAVKQYRERHK